MKVPLLAIILLILPISLLAQENILVTGMVTEADTGMPVPSVNVVEKGTSNGVLTNFDGEFAIEVPSDAILVFSFVGYEAQEVALNGKTDSVT